MKGLPTYLTRDANPGARITSGIPQPGAELALRALVVSIDKEKRSLELSFSSEIEVKRWPGFIEVLDHGREAVDLSRLNARGPLLFNHDLDKVVGVIENAEIGMDRKGRALVRFGNSTRANEVWQDVQDGILSNVSVGYRIHEIKLKETRENGDDVYVVTRWEPYEISIVSAPADTSVGVGRSVTPPNKPKIHPMKDKLIAAAQARGLTLKGDETEDQLLDMLAVKPEPTVRTVTVTQDNTEAATAERKRAADILAAGKQFKADDLAARAVAEGKTVDQFRTELLAEIEKRNTSLRNSNQPIGLSDKEVKDFQFLRLFRHLVDPQSKSARDAAAFELEVVEAARSHRKQARGVVIPVDILRAPLSAEARRNIVSIKTGSGYTGTGDNTVQTTLLASSYFELLRNRTTIMQLGTVLGGLVGDFDMPKQATNASNASWIGEDEEAPQRAMTFGQISLRPKTVAAHAAITRKMLMQSSLDVEALVRRDIASAMAQAIDFAGYYGDETGNTPKGIRYTTGINAVFFAAANPTWLELVQMETEIAADNIDPAAARYVFNARMRGHTKTTQKFPTTPTGMTIWENGSVNGYGTEITNQLTNGHVFFGDFSELIIGMWGGLDIIVDPYTESKRGRIIISNFQDVDFEVRRPEAFTFGVPLAAS